MKRMAMVTVGAVVMGGCYFHAVTKETTRVRRVTGDVIAAPEDRPALTMTVTARQARVVAEFPRACLQAVYQVTETTRAKRAVFEAIDVGSGFDGGGAVAVIMLPILAVGTVVGLVSGVVTAIEVGADDARTSVSDPTPLAAISTPCARAARGLAVELVLPSGRVLEGVTGADGVVTFPLPAGEATGPATARGGEATPVHADYFPDRAACLAARSARFAAVPEDGTLRAAALEALPICEAHGAGQRRVEAAWLLARRAGAAAWRADCATAATEAAALKVRAPSLYGRLVGQGAYARCPAGT